MQEQTEIWKPVVGYEGLYEISSLGRVKRLAYDYVDKWGRSYHKDTFLMKIYTKGHGGYPCVSLTKDGKQRKYPIHRLIMLAFVPNPDNLPCINHKDEDPTNSVLDNLEWCTYSYNITYGHAIEKRTASYRASYKHKTICQYTTDGVLINKYTCGVRATEKLLGIKGLSGCLTHREHNCTIGGYVWRYEDEPFSFTPQRNTTPYGGVIEIDDDGNIVQSYPSILQWSNCTGIDRHAFCDAKSDTFSHQGKTYKLLSRRRKAGSTSLKT